MNPQGQVLDPCTCGHTQTSHDEGHGICLICNCEGYQAKNHPHFFEGRLGERWVCPICGRVYSCVEYGDPDGALVEWIEVISS